MPSTNRDPPQTPPSKTFSLAPPASRLTPRSPGGSALRASVNRPEQLSVAPSPSSKLGSSDVSQMKRKVLTGATPSNRRRESPAASSRTPTKVASSPSGTPTRTPVRLVQAKVGPTTTNASPANSTPRSSMKEQIAAKRRELQEAARAKKSSSGSISSSADDEDSLLQESLCALSVSHRPSSSLGGDTSDTAGEEVDIFGRSLTKLINKALTTGKLNICSMELERLPKELWTKVLGMPERELSRPPTPPPELSTPRAGAGVFGQPLNVDEDVVPSYEVEDLTQLKAASNMIKDIEGEIGLFGSLKILDLRDNQLRDLPSSFANLLDLTYLDLSRNNLTDLPKAIILLPRLGHLDTSHNNISRLDFSSPVRPTRRIEDEADFMGHFPSTPTKAPFPKDPDEILPNLKILKLTGNGIGSSGLPPRWPAKLQQVELGENVLSGKVDLSALADLSRLEQLTLQGNEITKCFSKTDGPFPSLQYLNLSGNKINEVGWIDDLLGGREFCAKGLEDWEGSAVIVEAVSNIKLYVNLAKNQLSSAAVTSARDSSEILRQASPQVEVPQEDSAMFNDDPVRRRLFGTLEDETRSFANVGVPGTAAASTKFAPYWDERSGTLDIPADFCKTLLDENNFLDLAQAFEDDTVNGKLVSMLFKPVLAIKGVVCPKQRIASLSSVVSLSITYTSLASQPQLFQDFHRCFPTLQHLDLSGNLLENIDGVADLVAGGLKSLRLKDGKLDNLQGLEHVAGQLRSSSWLGLMQLEEIDIRDNDIAKLDPILGWLPLTSFQVDGNAFRVPARRIYEKGTPELLRWLRDRVE